jgi:hypothetical protein
MQTTYPKELQEEFDYFRREYKATRCFRELVKDICETTRIVINSLGKHYAIDSRFINTIDRSYFNSNAISIEDFLLNDLDVLLYLMPENVEVRYPYMIIV